LSISLPADARSRLDEAALHLVDTWRAFSVDAVSQAEVAAATADVVARVAVAADPASSVVEEIGSPLQRRVLVELRRVLLEQQTPAAADHTVQLLRAIESVARAMEPGWSERFQDRLTGPSGLDLVVEVAHDLRSPLTSILFLAETMLRGRSGALTALQERQLGLVYSAAFGLNAVASDVIELVRGGDRLVGSNAQPFSITEVLEAVGDIVLPIAEEKGLSLTFTAPRNDRRIGHPGALNRVLLNLTTNGLKFTAEGGVTVELREEAGNPERLRCTVHDTGRGIPEAAMPMLFEPFRRRQQAGDYAFSGSGLGLSICRKLVEAMGSELSVHTVQGEGTTFAFDLILPLADRDALIG
jgi:signal transduction histidine kinase